MRKYKIAHLFIWIIWAILFSYSILNEKTQLCYNQLYGKYFSYNVFKWFEIIYVGGGALVIFELFSVVNKKWAYIIFEVIFILIVVIHLRVLFC